MNIGLLVLTATGVTLYFLIGLVVQNYGMDMADKGRFGPSPALSYLFVFLLAVNWPLLFISAGLITLFRRIRKGKKK